MLTTFIALLRGVNVVGANSVPMKELVRILESLGLTNVKTYIQSGNVVFQASEKDAAALPEKITAKLRRKLGCAPQVFLLTPKELEAAIKSNPYRDADSSPKALHLTFLASAPDTSRLKALETFRKDSELYSLKERIFYFWAPEGVGRSKLFSRVEKTLGVAGTARNWRTVCKLRNLAQEIADGGPKMPKAR